MCVYLCVCLCVNVYVRVCASIERYDSIPEFRTMRYLNVPPLKFA